MLFFNSIFQLVKFWGHRIFDKFQEPFHNFLLRNSNQQHSHKVLSTHKEFPHNHIEDKLEWRINFWNFSIVGFIQVLSLPFNSNILQYRTSILRNSFFCQLLLIFEQLLFLYRHLPCPLFNSSLLPGHIACFQRNSFLYFTMIVELNLNVTPWMTIFIFWSYLMFEVPGEIQQVRYLSKYDEIPQEYFNRW